MLPSSCSKVLPACLQTAVQQAVLPKQTIVGLMTRAVAASEELDGLKPFVIAVDGPAASGKGTLSRLLATHFQCVHLDTGSLYRAVAWGALSRQIDLHEEEVLAGLAGSLDFGALPGEQQLRLEEVGQAASKVSVFPLVRQALLQVQRQFASHPPSGFRGAVLDGRDVGTVVVHDATAKLFVTARVAVRAERRFKELAQGHQKEHQRADITYEAVLKEMIDRDARDASRSVAPCEPAADALILDTSTLSIPEVLRAAVAFVESHVHGSLKV